VITPFKPPLLPPKLRPGLSAWGWRRRIGTAALVGVGGLFGMQAGSMLPDPVRPVLVLFAFGFAVCSGILMLVAGFALYFASQAERNSGYTTLSGSRYRDLWQLDAKTGSVVRRPGEPRQL